MFEKKYEIIKRETLFQGFFSLDRLHLRHELFEGGMTAPFTREVFNIGAPCAYILPFDPQKDCVVLVEQFRAGAIERGDDPWLIQAVAGIADGNESLEETARREAKEEAGCTVAELQHIMDTYPSPGATSQFCSLYVGRTVVPDKEGIYGLASENEDIRMHVMPASKAINLLFAKKIFDAPTVIMLQWFALRHTELRSQWLVSQASTPII
jgi:ADP-ribose pyrophosphatase